MAILQGSLKIHHPWTAEQNNMCLYSHMLVNCAVDGYQTAGPGWYSKSGGSLPEHVFMCTPVFVFTWVRPFLHIELGWIYYFMWQEGLRLYMFHLISFIIWAVLELLGICRYCHICIYYLPFLVADRNGGGSEKMDPGSDPMDLDPRCFQIIDQTMSFCREIHWNHRSGHYFCREIQWDPRSQLDICQEIWVHRLAA